jgi:hypothetical protein
MSTVWFNEGFSSFFESFELFLAFSPFSSTLEKLRVVVELRIRVISVGTFFCLWKHLVLYE